MKTLLSRWVDAENGMEVIIFVNLSDRVMVRVRDTDAEQNVSLISPKNNDMAKALDVANEAMKYGNYVEVVF